MRFQQEANILTEANDWDETDFLREAKNMLEEILQKILPEYTEMHERLCELRTREAAISLDVSIPREEKTTSRARIRAEILDLQKAHESLRNRAVMFRETIARLRSQEAELALTPK